MRIPRIYYPHSIRVGEQIPLSEDAFHHIIRVLRMKPGQVLELFSGDNFVFHATIRQIGKRNLIVEIDQDHRVNRESPLHLHLGQVVPRGERMEFTIQKSVELGVTLITPLFSERSGVKWNELRREKKIQQWQKIVISACEQCGRNSIPKIREPMTLEAWSLEPDETTNLTLHPRSQKRINDLPDSIERVRLLVGPEGGLSDEETSMLNNNGFTNISLGPRVLRTETTALTAMTALQVRFGDLG